MSLKKVYILRGGVKANLEKVYILIFFFLWLPLGWLSQAQVTGYSCPGGGWWEWAIRGHSPLLSPLHGQSTLYMAHYAN